MSKDHSPKARSREIALRVHGLYTGPNGRKVFAEQIAQFQKEAEERAREHDRGGDAKRQAIKAVWKEQEGLRKRTRKRRRLTDPGRPPGEGYLWRHEVYDFQADEEGRYRVRYALGWMPRALFDSPLSGQKWPWPGPSQAAKFAALALLHDEVLPDSTPILDKPAANSLGLTLLRHAVFMDVNYMSLDEMFAAEGEPLVWTRERLDALRTYLADVRARLEEARSDKKQPEAADSRQSAVAGRGGTAATDAAILRKIADDFREWGRKAGPAGRKPQDVPEEERDAARKALLLAVSHLDVITRACDRYGCAEGVAVTAGVFDKLRTAAAEHDLNTDLGKYWVWKRDLTEKHLPGNVSFPDELDRWARRLEQEPADSRQPAVAAKPDQGEWTVPMALSLIQSRLGIVMDNRKARKWLEKTYGLIQVSRQSYQVRLDTMPDNLRALLEAKSQNKAKVDTPPGESQASRGKAQPHVTSPKS